MTPGELRGQLDALLELLVEERERAKALDMDGLQQVTRAKEQLLRQLEVPSEQVADHQDLLQRIDAENRRNAFLLWTGLNWVRDMMGFMGNAAMPQVYGGGGQSQAMTQNGRLLSGKV